MFETGGLFWQRDIEFFHFPTEDSHFNRVKGEAQ